MKILYAHIAPDPQQVRRRIRGITELADSIAEHGLLQNIVLRPDPTVNNLFLVVAGERRYQAIGLLIKDGRWPREKPVPAICLNTDGVWENIVENEHRQDVPPWELGHRYCELLDTGRTQIEIAARTGTTQGRVSRHIQMAQGLAPETIALLNKTSTHWTFGDLYKVSKLLKAGQSIEERVPDVEAQIAAVKRLAGVKGSRKVRAKRSELKSDRDRVFTRYKKLRDMVMHCGTKEDRAIESIVNYLSGKDGRLKLEI